MKSEFNNVAHTHTQTLADFLYIKDTVWRSKVKYNGLQEEGMEAWLIPSKTLNPSQGGVQNAPHMHTEIWSGNEIFVNIKEQS